MSRWGCFWSHDWERIGPSVYWREAPNGYVVTYPYKCRRCGKIECWDVFESPRDHSVEQFKLSAKVSAPTGKEV